MITLIELIVSIAIVLFLLTQVIIPMVLGRQIFPMFCKPASLEDELSAVKQEIYETELAEEVEVAKKVLSEKQKHLGSLKEEDNAVSSSDTVK